MAQIRDTNIIKTPPVTVDPRLFVPDGIIDISVLSPEIDPDNPGEVIDGEIIQTGDAGTDVNIANAFKLPTPTVVTIESQEMRFGPDGRAVVDVVINVEDIPGVSNYDVRTTKG